VFLFDRFALVHLQTEASSRIVMEKLPQKDLHGQSPVVTPCNRQSLNQFEQQSKARKWVFSINKQSWSLCQNLQDQDILTLRD